MSNASAQSNNCLLIMDHDPVNRVAYKHSLATFQDHDSELFEGKSGLQGLKLASVRQSDRVRKKRQLPDLKDDSVQTKQAENAEIHVKPTAKLKKLEDAVSLSGNQLKASISHPVNTTDSESSNELSAEALLVFNCVN